ncbi:MAG TPA: acyl-CoA carboxylase subunit beta [Chloroflexi bacterium]|nr:acyl-CoA carboxylase subunit beta [Chloroflexota bacterium]
MADFNATLSQLRKDALLGGGDVRIQKQHQKGKGTARERIDLLIDSGSFQEIGIFATRMQDQVSIGKPSNYGDGVITGKGTIDGRPVYIFAQDFTVMGGSVGKIHGKKIANIMDLAYQNGAPLIGLNDSGGARIQEGVNSLAAYGEIFFRNVRASGVIPQISIILGPCAGGAVYSPAITDFVFMVDGTSQMFITGPEVIKEVTQEEIDLNSLGGADVHHNVSGVVHFKARDEKEVFEQVLSLLSYLPSNNLVPPPASETLDEAARPTPELDQIVPGQADEPYDIQQVIACLVDEREFLEIQEDYARNLVVGFARMDGQVIGLVANQPDHLAGVLDINASDKGARFIRFCDSFHIPLVTLVDTPGFLPGIEQEHEGIIRHGAKMIFAYAEATVPKITLVLRKAYGGAYIVMGSKHLKGDQNFAWPNAEIAVMGPQGAVKILHRKELADAEDPVSLQAALSQEYRDKLASPFLAAGEGHLDDIIFPSETRTRIIQALHTFKDKRVPTPNRKHGNIPL